MAKKKTSGKKTTKKAAAKAKPAKKATKKTAQKPAKKAAKKQAKKSGKKASSGAKRSQARKPTQLLDQHGQPPRGWTMGDHQFFAPEQPGPLERMEMPPRQILGATPPSCFQGIVREAIADSPVNRLIRKGKWCGHMEPTFTAFDIVIDGHEEVEVSAILEPPIDESAEEDPDDPPLPRLIAARAPGGPWHALFRHEWAEQQNALRNITKAGCTPEESAQLDEATDPVRAAVGFEYPCDAESPDDASWMILDFLLKGEKKVVTVVHDELA